MHIEQENIWKPATKQTEELCILSGRNIFGSMCTWRLLVCY